MWGRVKAERRMRSALLLFFCWKMLFAGAGGRISFSTSSGTDPVGMPYFSPAETQHVLSVSVYVYALPLNETQIIYTLDGSAPVRDAPATTQVKSGAAIFLDTLGETLIRAIGIAPGRADSPEGHKRYAILGRCNPPAIEPAGGTFAGSIEITLLGPASAGGESLRIFYTMDGSLPSVGSSLSVESGASLTLTAIGTTTIKCIAFASGLAPSSVVEATFVLLPKVAPVTIAPETSVFTISATLQFTCATPHAVIYYTLTDGTEGPEPTFKSLTVANLGTVTVEQSGRHTVRAVAMESSMLPSDVVTRVITILDRAAKPRLSPPSGTLVGDVRLSFLCTDAMSSSAGDDGAPTDWSWRGGDVYYTIGLATPSSSSPHVQCGQSILLRAPGHYVVRAYVHSAAMSASSIVQGEYKITRPAADTFPVKGAWQFRVQPVVDVQTVATADGSAQGRLVVLDNPMGHFDVILPTDSDGEGFGTVSAVGAAFSPVQIDMPPADEAAEEFQFSATHRAAYAAAMAASSEAQAGWDNEYLQVQGLGCQLASSAGVFNQTMGLSYGSLVAGGNVIQTQQSSWTGVHFGLRAGNFTVGRFSEAEINDPALPWDALISGAGWLVREGRAYIQESLSASGDAEDVSMWPADFATARAARTAIGYDAAGRLLLLQLDGAAMPVDESSAAQPLGGVSLSDLAHLAVGLGFVSAVNIQPGSLTQNHSLVSFPPRTCGDQQVSAAEGSFPLSYVVRRCEQPVPSVICIHAWPPLRRPRPDTPSPTLAPATAPASLPPPPTLAPTLYPTPTWMSPIYSDFPGPPSPGPTVSLNLTSASPLAAMERSLRFFKQCSFVLSGLLILSLLVHFWVCVRTRGDDGGSGGGGGGGKGGGIELSVGTVQPPPHRMQVSHPKKRLGGADPPPADAGGGDRSVYHLSATPPPLARRNQSSNPRDWQAKLGSINLTVDSDSEEDDGPDGVEVVDFYRRDLPQMRDGRKISTAPTPSPSSRAPSAKWSASRAQAPISLPYAQLGNDDEEDDGAVNPFHRQATR